MNHIKHYVLLLSIFSIVYSCKQPTLHLNRIEGKFIPVTEEISRDSSIQKLIAPYKEQLDSKMNTILAYAPTDFYKSKVKPETNIGNFMADLCYKQGNPIFHKQKGKNIDFVLLNYGGIRAGIAKGDVTTKSAFEVMPFENNMVVTELSYEKLQELFDYLAKSGLAHPISKQLQIVTENSKLKTAKIQNKEINKNNTYYILTSDYLQRGGDRMNFFKNPINLYDLEYKIRSAIIDELTEIDTIRAMEDGRFIRND